jgi:putative tricarboxylic transport membrane protein
MFEVLIENFQLGFQFFFTWYNLIAVAFGVFVGIMIGAIPGLTATMAVALLVPVTFGLEAVTSLALLVGVYKGGIYGGSITAILMNTPGTPSAAATLFDGYPLAQQGKALKALKMALYASVTSDLLSNMLLILVAAPIATAALRLGPPEMTMLLVFALTIVGAVSGDSLTKGLLAAFFGMLLATIGIDQMTGATRFSFGSIELTRGLALLPVLIGLFALPEILVYAEKVVRRRRTSSTAGFDEEKKPDATKPEQLIVMSADRADNRVSLREFFASLITILRSTGIGTFIGALPGIGSVVASFVSYGLAKRRSRNPEEFGKGSLEGLAAAESGNNAVTGATLIPLLTLGIPGDTITAVMLGAFLIQGLIPGPRLLSQNPGEVYGLFVALIAGNLALLFLGYHGLRLFAKLANTAKSLVYAVVIPLCVIGSFAVENSVFDSRVMVVFGALGYLMRRTGVPIPPLLIAFVLSPMLETSFKQTLILSRGSLQIFIERPIALLLGALTIISTAAMAFRKFRSKSRLGALSGAPKTPGDKTI